MRREERVPIRSYPTFAILGIENKHKPRAVTGIVAPSVWENERVQATTDRRVSSADRKRRDRVIPDQHGAWGFLVLPVVLGAAAGGWSWLLLQVTAAG